MSLRINNNVEAFNAHRQLQATSSQMAKSMEKLSSGQRINKAADDAAGLAISDHLGSQIERIGTSAEFNGTKLLNVAGTVSFQVGSNDSQTITVSTISLGEKIGSNVFSMEGTGSDISQIDA